MPEEIPREDYPMRFYLTDGAYGYDGRGYWWHRHILAFFDLFDTAPFMTITKTITFFPKKGNERWYNPFRCHRLIRTWPWGEDAFQSPKVVGIVSADGLANCGFEAFVRRYGLRINEGSRDTPLVGRYRQLQPGKRRRVIVSIHARRLEFIGLMARELAKLDIAGIELNIAQNETGYRLSKVKSKHKFKLFEKNIDFAVAACEMLKSVTQLPIYLKVSIEQFQAMPTLLERLEQCEYGVRIRHADFIRISPMAWGTVYRGVTDRSPLEHLGDGSLAGIPAQELSWKYAQYLQRHTDIPIIAGSIWSAADVDQMHERCGITAFALDGLHRVTPWRPLQLIAEHQEKWFEARLPAPNPNLLYALALAPTRTQTPYREPRKKIAR